MGKGKFPVVNKLSDNLDVLKTELGFGISFDVVFKEIKVAHKKGCLAFLDGFINDDSVIQIMKGIQKIPRLGVTIASLQQLIEEYVPFFETSIADSLEAGMDQLVSGAMLLLIDGINSLIVFDVRQYVTRGSEEPVLEKVTRGSRDGFVETALFNVNLIRRRIRDPNLRFEALQVGRRSKTDVLVGYIKDIADPSLVEEAKKRIGAIDRDALPMGGKNLEEYILGTVFNPLPVTRYTERPDVAAAHLLEGHIVILVDTTPFVLIVPVTVWHFTQHAEEYFQNPAVGTYLRWVRTLGIFISLVLLPIWYLLATEPNLPEWLAFIGPKEPGRVALWLQLLILEIGLDIIRMALIHTPDALATSLGLVGATILGEMAVSVGLFTGEAILYTAIVAICVFATPSIEFGMAVRLFRYLLFFGAILGGFFGFGIALLITILIFGLTKSFGIPYLWPLVPFDGAALLRIIFRYPIPQVAIRPRHTNPRDKSAQNDKNEGAG
ncbi:MAG: spore germination protein [Bacillota bacterium]|nr:spore germination protein [Bacillota bacterium]HHU62193.1 spore germination protein [Natronincola sp.]